MDKPLKILIIDDGKSFSKIVTRMMVRAGLIVEITEAINCAEGAEKLNKNIFLLRSFGLSVARFEWDSFIARNSTFWRNQLPNNFCYRKRL
jgi:hypothetical protein